MREPVDKDVIDAIESTRPLFESRQDDLNKLKRLLERGEVVNASDVKSGISAKYKIEEPKLELK